MNQSMFSIAYTKSFEVKPNSIITLTPNLTESFSTLWFFFWDILVCKHCTWHIVRNILNFFTIATTYDIMRSWQISWFLDIICFFLEFKNHTTTRSWSCFLNKMVEISFHSPCKASHWTQQHEYHFSTHFILLFVSLAIQIWLKPQNSLKSNKLIKYIKWI